MSIAGDPAVLKWRGTPLTELSEDQLHDAYKQLSVMQATMIREMARRGMFSAKGARAAQRDNT